jgi:hypothetical protein
VISDLGGNKLGGEYRRGGGHKFGRRVRESGKFGVVRAIFSSTTHLEPSGAV